MIPTARSRGSKGTFVAIALAIAFVVGAFVGFGQMGWIGGNSDASHVAAHSIKPVVPVRTAAPVATAPAPEPSASDAPADAPSTEPAVATTAGQGKTVHRSAVGHAVARVVTAPSVETKPPVQKTNTAKPGVKSGFVPPPMSDPGF
jgi:hypothetical protein